MRIRRSVLAAALAAIVVAGPGSDLAAQRPVRTLRLSELERALATVGAQAGSLAAAVSAVAINAITSAQVHTATALAADLAIEPALAAAAALAQGIAEELPPKSRFPQDPADSLYREARQQLNRGNYSRAAFLFEQIHEKHPRSSYAPDAFYWQAFALHRIGSTSGLNRALDLIRRQGEVHPQAATRRDADGLAARIRGELAQRGDSDAAREVTAMARALTETTRQASAATRAQRAQQSTRRVRCREEDDERIAALNALLNMDDDRALGILEKVMARRDEGSVCLRRRAVFMISQQSGPRAESMLLAAVASDPDSEVREQGVFWLSQVDSERAVTVLDSLVRTSDDPTIQEKAIFALSQHQSPRAMQALRDFARRESAPLNLRENAIFWLGQGGREENGQFLRSLYNTVREPELKEKIIFSLSQHGSRESARWLLEIAANRNEPTRLRKNAIFWAGQTGADLPELFGLYDRSDDREIREHLIFVYSQNGKRAAVDKLIDIARNDPDRELHKKAVFWLSQTNDPRAVELLSEILERP